MVSRLRVAQSLTLLFAKRRCQSIVDTALAILYVSSVVARAFVNRTTFVHIRTLCFALWQPVLTLRLYPLDAFLVVARDDQGHNNQDSAVLYDLGR